PVYLRPGETRELMLAGRNLDKPTGVVLSDVRRLIASIDPPSKPKGPVYLKISARERAPLGDSELRIVTAGGVTQPVTITIGQYPAILEKEPNNAPESAQQVQLPACLIGTVNAGGDADHYRFEAK